MAASCRKAAQARLWSQFFKDPSLWNDNRNTKVNYRDPDFTHKLTNQPLWLDSQLSPSWVHDRLASAKAKDFPSIPEWFDGRYSSWSIHMSKPAEICKEDSRCDLRKIQGQHDAQPGAHLDLSAPYLDHLGCQQKLDGNNDHAPSFKKLRVFVSSQLKNQGNNTQDTLLLDKGLGIQRNKNPLNGEDFHSSNLQSFLQKYEKERDLFYSLQLQHYVYESGHAVEKLSTENLILALVEDQCMSDAQEVFEKLEYKCESLWSALITGYARCGKLQQALNLYKKVQDRNSLKMTASLSLALLKACAELNDIETGEKIHAKLNQRLVENNAYVGSCLIHMYAQCGNLGKAQEVFDNFQEHCVATWNTLISGYVENGHNDRALAYYKQMDLDGVSPDAITLVCILKACGNKGDIGSARKIHEEILKKGFLAGDSFLSSGLVDTYARCGSLVEAQKVFVALPSRNIVSWNSMISRLAECGYSEMALHWFEKMQHDISPDEVTLTSSLKACANIAAGTTSQNIHSHIIMIGILDDDIFFGSILVDVYAKCGWITDMQYVFESFLVRDVVLWNAFISGLVEVWLHEKALSFYDQMRYEGICPNAGTYIPLLKACSYTGGPFKGQGIHVELVKQGLLEQGAYVGSILVDAYAKCGLFVEAQNVFKMLPARDVASWNALLSGYLEYMLNEEVLNHSKLMQTEGIAPDAITFGCTLKACRRLGAINEGRELHKEIVKTGLRDREVDNALIDMYSKCLAPVEAQHVLDHLPTVDVMSLNTIISGFIENGDEEKVLHFYKQKLQGTMTADAITLVCSLKACGNLKATAAAQEIHREAVCKGLEKDILLSNTLVDVYSRCGLFTEAHETFHDLETQDVVAWTALLTGYAEHGYSDDALHYFEKMLEKGTPWDDVLLTCILAIIGKEQVMSKGRALHAEAMRRGSFDRIHSVGNGFLAMYAKCGALGDAKNVLYSLPYRDSVSWNTYISGCMEFGCVEEAFGLFKQMSHDGVSFDVSLLVCGLKACSCMAAAEKGGELHLEIVEKGLEADLLVGNTLVDMYVKCAALPAAQYAFDKLEGKDLVSWNTLLAGYGQHGCSEDVLRVFDEMKAKGVQPDSVTFSCILMACSHAGLVEMGQMYLLVITRDGFIPSLEHFTCIVDMLGRTGKVDNVMSVINEMPSHPNMVTWRSALGACQKWGNLDIGRHAFENAVALDDKDAGAYVCMCNLYESLASDDQGSLMANEKGR